ncbi:MAG: RNA methyltransferase [Phycisphaerales bacterium]|nr:RNA methyltransferase [Phycisphaerales bacterium]
MQKLSMSALERKSINDFQNADKQPIILILDNVRSMNNVGSIFRTADAFLIEAIYLCGLTPCPPHRDIHKTALGSTESVCWYYFKDIQTALDDLGQKKYAIYAVEQVAGSTYLQDFKVPDDPIALIIGNEVDGVQDTVLSRIDRAIEVPQFGTKHSLNITVATGIVLWQCTQQYLTKRPTI